jgi:hypothetical protein
LAQLVVLVLGVIWNQGVHRNENIRGRIYIRIPRAVTSDPNSIDASSKGGASAINAAITREQWEDYKKRFQPYEDRLAAIYKNGGMMEGEAERIPEAVNQSFTTMRGIADRQLSRYGISPNEDQAVSRNRMASLDQAIASVDAKNNLYATADERQDKIMTGGINTMRQKG